MKQAQQVVERHGIRAFHILDRAYLSGVAYYDYQLVYRAIKPGDRLTLRRESENRHDRFAVEVYFCGRKLGYWPHPENKALANMMDQGVKIRARVISVNPDRENIYEAVNAEAYMHNPPVVEVNREI
jgi:hypothetical protein